MKKSDDLIERIEELPPETLAAKLEPLLPSIDRRLRQRIRYRQIVELLKAEGIDITEKKLSVYVANYRRREGLTSLKRKKGEEPSNKTAVGDPSRKPKQGDPRRGLVEIRDKSVDLHELAQHAKDGE